MFRSQARGQGHRNQTERQQEAELPLQAKQAGAAGRAGNWGLTIGNEAIENKVKRLTVTDRLNGNGTLKNHRLASA
jgi:hypothetical protein